MDPFDDDNQPSSPLAAKVERMRRRALQATNQHSSSTACVGECRANIADQNEPQRRSSRLQDFLLCCSAKIHVHLEEDRLTEHLVDSREHPQMDPNEARRAVGQMAHAGREPWVSHSRSITHDGLFRRATLLLLLLLLLFVRHSQNADATPTC